MSYINLDLGSAFFGTPSIGRNALVSWISDFSFITKKMLILVNLDKKSVFGFDSSTIRILFQNFVVSERKRICVISIVVISIFSPSINGPSFFPIQTKQQSNKYPSHIKLSSELLFLSNCSPEFDRQLDEMKLPRSLGFFINLGLAYASTCRNKIFCQ